MDNNDILNIRFKLCNGLEYTVDEEGIVTILEKQNHKIQKFFRMIKFNIPMYKRITLDKYSSEVFRQIDGNKTVKQIGEELDIKFGEDVYPLYERLLIFLNHINVNYKYIEKIS